MKRKKATVTPVEIKDASAEIEMLLKLLAETPHRITSVIHDHENVRLHFKSDENTWSANDILAHLRACADVWGKSIQRMLTEETPTFRYVSPRTWIKRTNYPELPFHESFQVFSKQRHDLLEMLKTLGVEDWLRRAIIDGREQTILSYIRRMAQHENGHCEQIEAILKSM